MRKVKLYECEYCCKMDNKENIQIHEKECGIIKEKEKQKIEQSILKSKTASDLRLEAESPEHFGKLLSDWAKKFYKVKCEVSFNGMGYREVASNTHYSPIEGVTNWYQTDNIPKGYPALNGSVYMKNIKNPTKKSLSDIFETFGYGIQGFNTGSGGSRGMNDYGYSVTLFIDDFPKIKEKYIEWLKLNAKSKNKVSEQQDRYFKLQDKIVNALEANVELNSLKEQRDEISEKITSRIRDIRLECEIKNKHLKNTPKRFDFDIDRYKELSKIFEGGY